MEPTLSPGDRLLVVRPGRCRWATWWPSATPGTDGRVLVKRMTAVSRRAIVLRGDNPGPSTDSRQLRARAGSGASSDGSSAATRPPWRAGRGGADGQVHRPSPGLPGREIELLGEPSGATSPARYASQRWPRLEMELDRLFAPDYLDGVDERSLEDVRAMRAECQEAERSSPTSAAWPRAGSTWSTLSSTTTNGPGR